MMKRIVLIGLGNPLMSDEGIGIRVVQELLRTGNVSQNVDALDLGTGGLRVLYECCGYDKAIFVDCGFMNRTPGSLVKFTPAEVHTVKVMPRQSLHEGDLFETLELAKRLGQCPEEIVIFAVEPATVALGDTLSEVLEKRLGSYVEAIAEELKLSPPTPVAHA
jgi:hydrogenase maturation protease